MKKIIFFVLVIFSFISAFAQQNFRDKERTNRVKQYKKLLQNRYTTSQNQAFFDAKYYLIHLDIDPATQLLSGKVSMECKAVIESISNIYLNLSDSMSVDSIKEFSSQVHYAHSNNILNITLNKIYNPGETIIVTIYYHGNPAATGLESYSSHKYNGKDHIWTLSEPFGARDWWPCKDIPEDKADSVDIIVTVPKDLIVASNGLLRKTVDLNNKKTYYWHESYPISTYLVSFAAYPYTFYENYYEYSSGKKMPIQYFIYPDIFDNCKPLIDKTPNMIKVFSELFGEYPFINEKYGLACFDWSGAMEHQTCTSVGGWNEPILVHELAHQWWGDMITCKDFHHIWLNEGFATYSEALYTEKVYGFSDYQNDMFSLRYLGEGKIYVDDLSDVNRIFHGGLSYNKGAWVLHMLRHVVGDSTFFKILKAYCQDTRYQYKVATTENFRDLCESIYGKDLDWFFEQWIYHEFFPDYSIEKQITPNGNHSNLKLTIKQVQNNYIFKMPIDINVSTSIGDTLLVVWDSLKTQVFNFNINGSINFVTIDNNNWILKNISAMTSVNDLSIPTKYSLSQNYPNPFNSSSLIKFSLQKDSKVTIKLYDLLGRETGIITDQYFKTGEHVVYLDRKNLQSGVYFYQMVTDNFKDTRKIILLK